MYYSNRYFYVINTRIFYKITMANPFLYQNRKVNNKCFLYGFIKHNIYSDHTKQQPLQLEHVFQFWY